MTEELNTTEQVEPEAPETEAPDTDDLDRWKTHSRLWQKRAQENLTRAEAGEAFASRVTELEAQLEEANGKVVAAETSLNEVNFKHLKSSIATENGISAEDSELLLTGTDEESLTRQAKALAARTPKDETPRVGFGVEGLQTREAGSGDTSMDELGRSIFGL